MMKVDKINIKNFKSLIDFEIVEPDPFTVYFGSNASGKSNLFEIMELVHRVLRYGTKLLRENYNFNEMYPFRSDLKGKDIEINIETDIGSISLRLGNTESPILVSKGEVENVFEKNFSRIFIGKDELIKHPYPDDGSRLNIHAGNLEKVLERILKDPPIKQEVIEWLKLFIPEFKNVDVEIDSLSKKETLYLFEEYSNKPFTKSLISDGTYNLLCLLTVVYQSDIPQFLLIEEPENGLNPKVIREIVNFFREICIDKGHHIWLNTHSQSLVSNIKANEAILIDKKNGKTRAKQFKDQNLYDLSMDEAWLSNVLGGGVPW